MAIKKQICKCKNRNRNRNRNRTLNRLTPNDLNDKFVLTQLKPNEIIISNKSRVLCTIILPPSEDREYPYSHIDDFSIVKIMLATSRITVTPILPVCIDGWMER